MADREKGKGLSAIGAASPTNTNQLAYKLGGVSRHACSVSKHSRIVYQYTALVNNRRLATIKSPIASKTDLPTKRTYQTGSSTYLAGTTLYAKNAKIPNDH